MKFRFTVTLAARTETLNAYSYYEAVQTGLGERFLQQLEERYRAIMQNPYLFSFTDGRYAFRDCALSHFPYIVVYEITGEEISILSVHNRHKKPRSF